MQILRQQLMISKKSEDFQRSKYFWIKFRFQEQHQDYKNKNKISRNTHIFQTTFDFQENVTISRKGRDFEKQSRFQNKS